MWRFQGIVLFGKTKVQLNILRFQDKDSQGIQDDTAEVAEHADLGAA
jgi:hypothetical protein